MNKIEWFKDEEGIKRVKYFDVNPIDRTDVLARYGECDFSITKTKTECIEFVDELMNQLHNYMEELRCVKYYLQCAKGYFPENTFMNLIEGDEFPYIGQRVFAVDSYGDVHSVVYQPSEDGVWKINGNKVISWYVDPRDDK